MRVGDKVRITTRTGDTSTCHEFELGGVGLIVRKPDDKGRYGVAGTGDSYWRCHPAELETVPSESEVTAIDRPAEYWG